MSTTTTPKVNVCIDTRRAIFMLAKARPKSDVLKEKDEDFIRRTLKERMGWGKKDPAPQSIKDAAKEMAQRIAELKKQEAEVKAAEKAAAAPVDTTVSA